MPVVSARERSAAESAAYPVVVSTVAQRLTADDYLAREDRRRSPNASGFDIQTELTANQTLSSPLLPGFAITVGELLPAT